MLVKRLPLLLNCACIRFKSCFSTSYMSKIITAEVYEAIDGSYYLMKTRLCTEKLDYEAL